MRQIILYTGEGASLTPQYIEGRTQSRYVRLVADEGKMLFNGTVSTDCIDILLSDLSNWDEIEYIEPEIEPTDEELAEAGRVMMAYEHS